ncbi:hypothetical protein M2283_009047 [Streptomyces pseudovenezuelae]|uniref:Peptidoglycan-binding protein n=2 Tax=Streptomyces pseudovenezuelae TaxID=67350 RepID=A0ABT6LZH0_9ACTN|nr:hypothetical protein [Streptomyces pseudovenezuelae]
MRRSEHAQADEPPGSAAPGKARKRVVIAVAALLTAGVVGVSVAGVRSGGKPSGAAASGAPRMSTVAVVRTDLSSTLSLNGTLGYGRTVSVKGGKDGLVTQLPAVGAKVSRGRSLYRVDDRPVPVFYGTTPLFRPLDTRGLMGRDVKVVADNLRALGYDIGAQPASGSWVAQRPEPTGAASASPSPSPSYVRVKPGEGVLTASLIAAVGRWQTQVGMPSTGVLGAGDVAVLPGEVRVGAVQAQPGDPATGTLMSVTGTAKSVSVPLDATDVDSIQQGDKATVTLPDNSEAHGTVSAISTDAQASDQAGGDSGGTPQLVVTVSLDSTAALRRLNSAPVQVQFTGQTKKGVLAVPVGALLALSGGGYALQLPGGRLLAVETGMFAKGLVEVSGTGITAGTKVATAS